MKAKLRDILAQAYIKMPYADCSDDLQARIDRAIEQILKQMKAKL
jgi:hypothetical protein